MRTLIKLSLIAILIAVASVFAWAQGNLPVASAAPNEKRVALVIGNSEYEQLGTLANTQNDAREIDRALAQLGFATRLVLNVTEQALRREIRGFSARSEGASMALVFYAGHGAQVAGDNYLLPIDMDIPNREADIQLSAIKIGDLISSIKSNVKIVFLDACRDNPILFKSLSKGRGASYVRGLAPVRGTQTSDDRPDGGVFIAYATDAGNIAADGTSGHSPFTEALLRHIRQPMSIDDMFSLVTRDVRQATNNNQRPYKYASLERIICLTPSCKTIPEELKFDVRTHEGLAEQEPVNAYRAALAGNDLDELENIATKYPGTLIARTAKTSLEQIKKLFRDEWVLFGFPENDNVLLYYRPSSYRSGNGRVWVDVRQATQDIKAITKTITTSVFECATRKVGVSRGEAFDEGGKITSSFMSGDPRIIDLPLDVPKGSMNETLIDLLCPPGNPGRILSEEIVTSNKWKLLWEGPDRNGNGSAKIQVGKDSIEIKGTEVHAILKTNFTATQPATVHTYDTLVTKIAARCDKLESATIDQDFIGANGNLVEKLLPRYKLKWEAVTPNSALESVIKSLCLPPG